MTGYYNEYQPPQPNAALSIAGAAKQVQSLAGMVVGFEKLGWLCRPHHVGLQYECDGVPLTPAVLASTGL